MTEAITGITTLHDKIIRVYLGRNTVVDVIRGTQRTIYGRNKRPIRLDDKTITTLVRRGRKWLQMPSGSVIIHGHNKPCRYLYESPAATTESNNNIIPDDVGKALSDAISETLTV